MSESRKIAAILVSDIVGFSRLAGADEDRLLARLRALRSDLIDPIIAVHRGRVVKRTGDGALVEFRSVVDAVRCAIEVQNGMIERNTGVPPERRIEFRMGIHLGDVVEESDGDLMGDGVNIAARLEGVAQPGSICLSEDAYRQVSARLDMTVADLGPTQLKNIDRPIRIYALQVGTPAQAKPVAAAEPVKPAPGRARLALAALGVCALLAAGAVAWRSAPRPAMESDGMPTVAVLPFKGGPERGEFAQNLTKEVSAVLSTYPGAHTVSVAEAASARQSGAAYTLEGEAQATGAKTRIVVRLNDVATGENIWVDRYEFEGSDWTSIQEKAAYKIYGALGGSFGKILTAEIEKAWKKPDHELTDFDYYFRGRRFYRADTQEGYMQAQEVAKKGLERFPDSPALNLLTAASILQTQLDIGPLSNCHEEFARAWKYATESNKRKSKSRWLEYVYHYTMARLYNLHSKDFDRSLEEAETAMELAPNESSSRSALAVFFSFAGRHDRAIEWASFAMRQERNTTFSRYLSVNLAWTLYFAGRYEEALEAIKGNEMVAPDEAAAIYVRLGRLEEARAIVADWRKNGPFSIATESCWAIKEPMKSAFLDDLRKAGLPEN